MGDLRPEARPHLLVIDPGTRVPELESLNRLVLASGLPVTYHLPALFGLASLDREDPAAIKGLIVFGSGSSVSDRHPWQISLEEYLLPLLQRGIPTLGICYGHQMLARMFGGEVGYAWPDQHKAVGQRLVHLEACTIWPRQSGHLTVSHCEAVIKVPLEFRAVGHSSEVAVEALEHRHLPIWSLQSHPESTSRFLASQGILLTDDATQWGHQLVQGFLDYVIQRRQSSGQVSPSQK